MRPADALGDEVVHQRRSGAHHRARGAGAVDRGIHLVGHKRAAVAELCGHREAAVALLDALDRAADDGELAAVSQRLDPRGDGGCHAVAVDVPVAQVGAQKPALLVQREALPDALRVGPSASMTSRQSPPRA